MRLKALAEIYAMHSFAQLRNQNCALVQVVATVAASTASLSQPLSLAATEIRGGNSASPMPATWKRKNDTRKKKAHLVPHYI